jgi:hypothetical protein
VRAKHHCFVKERVALALLSWLLLAIGNRAAAISKLAVPELAEQDLPFYLNKPAHHDDAHFYLFSSLSLLSRRRASAVFELSSSPTSGITPLLSLEIHPPIDTVFQTEFSDVTVWGQLDNLFQKHLELLALDREVIALFKELEDLNARYLAQFGSQAIRPPTLDARNYLQRRPGANVRSEDKMGQQSKTAQNSKARQALLSLIQQHESAERSDRLAAQLVARAGIGRGSALEAKATAAASMRAAEAQQDPESTGTAPGGRIIYLFRLFRLVIRYLLENKIETLIYLWAFILLSIFVKAAYHRR